MEAGGDTGRDAAYLSYVAEEIYKSSTPRWRVEAEGLYILDPSSGIGATMTGTLPIAWLTSHPANNLTYMIYNSKINVSNFTFDSDGGPVKMSVRPTIEPSSGLSISMEYDSPYAPEIFACLTGSATYMTIHETPQPYTLGNNPFTMVTSIETRLVDDAPPKIENIVIPDGTYVTGQYVPIRFEFSEPVISHGITLTINGIEYPSWDLLMNTKGSRAVAFYKVLDIDATQITINKVANITDIAGNITESDNNNNQAWTFNDAKLESVRMRNAVQSVSVTPASLDVSDVEGGVTVNISLRDEVQYRTKYTNFDASGNNAPFSVLITNMTTNESWKVPAILVEPSANTLDAEAVFSDIDAAVADTDYLVQIIAHESSADTTGVLVPTPMTSFTVKGIVFVNGITISYAPPLALPDRTLDLSASETHRQMTLVFSGSSAPTFKSGTWTSSDSDIAYVGADGQIIPTNNKLGDVYFTFTADDGGVADLVTSNVKTVRSETFTVVAGSVPALVLPGEANTIFTQQNDPVQVRWSSNAKFFGLNTTFNYTIELFAGNFTGEQLGARSPVYTTTATSDKNNVIIPGEQFPVLSVGGAPAYTVRISMPHPIAATETLETVGYVVVRPKPAVAHVTPPADGLYILDGAATPIRWTVENYIDGETEGTLRVDRIRTENGADVTENIVSQPVTAGGGTYSLEPAAVQGLKDTYMVSLQVRNSTNTGYSSDSFPLYVYNSASLQLEIDGVKVGNTFAMDNEPAVRGTLPTETKNILALREELALIEYIGINYGDYDWSQLKDGIRWSTTDTSTLSINYRQGGLYENIARFSMSTYLPETKMAISSVTDGTATISATHANTGMSDSVTVSIKTLREKFYLFQLSPALRTELQYTDGTGKSKTVYTNDEGVLALYEPNRIASDIGLRASGSDNSIWLGTLYKSNLQSGERDATLLQLYPLNSFKLRQAAKAEIFLKNPDGSPFSGALKMSGGVYKNDGYCETAAMLGNTGPSSSNPLIDGKSEQSVTIGANGKLTVYMDSTQFWSAAKGENNGGGLNLQPRDRLQYVFVLKPTGNYRPCLIYVDGNLTPDDLMRSAESIVTLDANIGAAQSFIANQTIDYGLSGNRLIDVRNASTHIGPNETYREIKLLTTVLLWGESGATANYNLTMTDEFGYVPSNQKSEFIRYPFSDIMVVRNLLTLSKAAITDSGWIAKGKDAGLRARLSREATMLRDMSVLPRVTDLTDSPKLTESGEISGIIVDLQASSGTPGAEMSGTGDIIIGKLMGFLGNMSGPVDSSVFKMIITPSTPSSGAGLTVSEYSL